MTRISCWGAIVVGLLALGALGCTKSTPGQDSNVKITFESEPTGATVTAKGAPWPVGRTPVTQILPRSDGAQVFAFRLEGYKTETRQVKINGSQTIKVHLSAEATDGNK